MALILGKARRERGVARLSWYIRIGLYLAILLIMAYVVNSLRGRIPMAFGLTPIQVKALSVSRMPYGRSDSSSAMADVSVAVRIVGNDSVPGGIALGQFRLITKTQRRYEPYASTFLLDSTGRLRVARGDTLYGALIFTVPKDETPGELWWQP